ncbi:uncharacterized protein LOC116846362 isoform X3 [Odontomachus brunneus]|uniref:uncharacterized protein LOC116846362 isoform X3 n=1 Tax=Odontomachus brunneus TaxID=486640 RepID=UPI0013F28CE5|nr:uncharacterized protein LOC116846362 isoform X3 [Odontomachus brunneus]
MKLKGYFSVAISFTMKVLFKKSRINAYSPQSIEIYDQSCHIKPNIAKNDKFLYKEQQIINERQILQEQRSEGNKPRMSNENSQATITNQPARHRCYDFLLSCCKNQSSLENETMSVEESNCVISPIPESKPSVSGCSMNDAEFSLEKLQTLGEKSLNELLRINIETLITCYSCMTRKESPTQKSYDAKIRLINMQQLIIHKIDVQFRKLKHWKDTDPYVQHYTSSAFKKELQSLNLEILSPLAVASNPSFFYNSDSE